MGGKELVQNQRKLWVINCVQNFQNLILNKCNFIVFCCDFSVQVLDMLFNISGLDQEYELNLVMKCSVFILLLACKGNERMAKVREMRNKGGLW
jgi:hypothetical protein